MDKRIETLKRRSVGGYAQIERFIDMVNRYLEGEMMVSKVLKKMEALRRFIQIPTKSISEFVGSTPTATIHHAQ
ncbi:MAG: hypothetical protein ACP5LB_02275 [Candidatus Bathyarchaeia archaeon]